MSRTRDYIIPTHQTQRTFQAAQAPPPDGSLVDYIAFDSTPYTLIQYNGKHVAFLVQPASLTLGRYTLPQLRLFIDHLDVLYTHFQEMIGAEPPGTAPLLPIAFVHTCGGGCGYVGAQGIELAQEMLDPSHTEYRDGAPYEFAIHEMTHNFDIYSGYIMFDPDFAHSWTDFMNIYISVYNQEGSIDASGNGSYPAPFLQSYIDKFFTPYLTFPNSSWTTCVQNNACDPAGSMAQHAQGGMALRVAQLHGPAGIKAAIQYLSSAIVARGLVSDQMTKLVKNDLLLESLANGERVNISCYADTWNWPISSTLRAQLQNSFGANPNCADQDADGYSIVGGDCNDHNASVHPGATEVLNGIDDDCNGIVDDILTRETAEFGQSVATATPISFPARILGSIDSPTDGDNFRITLLAPATVRFELKSLGSFQGWLFLNNQNNVGWLQYIYAGSSATSVMTVTLAAGQWTFAVAYNNASAIGSYQVRVNPVAAVVPWPTALTAPSPTRLTPLMVTLLTPALPQDLLGSPSLAARFWVESQAWVGTQTLSGNNAASLNFTAPAGLGSCNLSYRVEFLSATLPASPTSNPAFFSVCGVVLNIAKVHTGSFSQGQTNATYTITVSSSTGSTPTAGTVTVTDTVPSGLTLVSMTGHGWTCLANGNTCTRSDALAGGASYPPITVTVNVGANATSPLVNSAAVSGGGSAGANTTDSATILALPLLSIGKTHTGSLKRGQNGAAYTVTVSNGAGAGPTIGTVTVTETVPSGLSLVSMTGAGWTCPTSGTTCTRSDALAGGASYPPIAVLVNVAANAAAQVTNQVSVSGGGSATAIATDPTATVSLGTDFNADGRPDVIWQDPVSGLAQVWFLGGAQGTSTLGAANLTASNTWRIVGVGDFNRDGRPDVVWQDPVTGAAQVWFLGGVQGNVVTGAAVWSLGNSWRIMSIADFNGDGQPDCIWQDPVTGLAQIWFMGGAQGATVVGAVNLTQSNSWRIAGTGDFNGDGRPDVIWQDPGSGAIQIWYLGGAQGNVVTNALSLSAGNSWRIASVGDFNGDGRPDVVLQDPVTGASQVWFLGGAQGTTITGTAPMSGANAWRIAGPR